MGLPIGEIKGRSGRGPATSIALCHNERPAARMRALKINVMWLVAGGYT